ncbi:hypothetical protein Nepgr_004801 [Nepenthes gracilis]|uniref:Uncharacterized protein n=1 Tax=Nepenthes gracilis TaxID=150966 RepID=A0AAD3S265_NEPGR|nr:hypothetical protein Nepgr_004801 [Nepenthes gracilis]
MKPIIDEQIPKYKINYVKFEAFTLGSVPPTSQGVKVHVTEEKELIMEPVLKWTGNPNFMVAVKACCLKITVQLSALSFSMIGKAARAGGYYFCCLKLSRSYASSWLVQLCLGFYDLVIILCSSYRNLLICIWCNPSRRRKSKVKFIACIYGHIHLKYQFWIPPKQ